MKETLFNVELEQALLGHILVTPEAIYDVGSLEAEHFFEPVHQRIYAAIQLMNEDGATATPVTLKHFFDKDEALDDIGGGQYLGKLAASALHVIDGREFADMLYDLAMKRAFMALCQQIGARCEDAAEPVEGLIQRMTDGLGGLLKNSRGSSVRNDYQVSERILERMKSPSRCFSTGMPRLDRCMDGGLYAGKAYAFAARKKVGKTAFAATLSCNLNQQGHKHLFICLEMNAEEIQERVLARLAQVHPGVFRDRNQFTDSVAGRVANEILKSNRCALYSATPGITFNELKRLLSANVMRHKITGFILDQWQLVKGKQKHQSTSEHLDEVAQWLAEFSRQHDLWSVTMAQINQDGNTRGSEGIRLACDQVYQINMPSSDPTSEERWLEMLETRYTQWNNIGTPTEAGFILNSKGPYFEEVSLSETARLPYLDN